MAKKQSLATWLRDCLNVGSIPGTNVKNKEVSVDEEGEVTSEFDSDETGKKCTSLVLVHHQGNRKEEVRAISIGSRAFDPKELAEMFEQMAVNIAGGIPGVQQFSVLCFFDEQDKPSSFYPWRLAGESDSYGLGTEPPTDTGERQASMRHTENIFRIAAGRDESRDRRDNEFFDMLMKERTEMRDEIKRMRQEELNTIELARNVILEKAANLHKHQMELEDRKSGNATKARLLQLLPVLVNQITGREIFPQGVADTALIDSLADHMTQDQIMKLSSILSGEQMAMVAPRLLQRVNSVNANRSITTTKPTIVSKTEEPKAS